MPTFPKYIRVGGHVIRVVLKKDLIKEHEAFGTWEDSALQITVDADLKPSLAWETFWHEVIEALNTTTDASLDHSTIQTFGLLLHQIFQSMYEKGQKDA